MYSAVPNTQLFVYFRIILTAMIHFLLHGAYKLQATAVAQWLRCCATNRKVAGSIPDGVIGIFH